MSGKTWLHHLARLRAGRLETGAGCRCAICGESPYRPAGPTAPVLGPTFTDHALLVPAPTVCVGCAVLLAGKPGDDPPPLRLGNLVAGEDWIEYPDRAGLYARIRNPGGVVVMSWAVSRKKHHWLRAGPCSPDRLLIGSDDATIEYRPARDATLLDAVSGLLASPTGTGSILSREAIRTGNYHPDAVRRFGVRRWQELESVVARWRPSGLLDLLVAVVPLSGPPIATEVLAMIDLIEDRAATLLGRIATASLVRRRNGKVFWDGFYRHRIERFKHLPLPDMVSRLMEAVAAPPTDPSTMLVVHDLAGMSEETMREVARCIEERAALVLAMAFDRLKTLEEG